MTDILLRMSNANDTVDYIKQTLGSGDYIVAVRQTGVVVNRRFTRQLVFADRREHLAAYPGPNWRDETVYNTPSVPISEFVLVNISSANGTTDYLLNRLGREDRDVAVRITQGPTTMTFCNVLAAFQNWTGPTGIPYDVVPPLSSGIVVPGGNWMPSDDVYVSVLANMLRLPERPDLVNFVVDALRNPEETEELLNDPRAFLNKIAVENELEVDAALAASFETAIRDIEPQLESFRER